MSTRPINVASYIADASDNFDCQIGCRYLSSGRYIFPTDNVARNTISFTVPFANALSILRLRVSVSNQSSAYLCTEETLVFRTTAYVPVYQTIHTDLGFGTAIGVRTFVYATGSPTTPALVVLQYAFASGTTAYLNVNGWVQHASTAAQTLPPLINYRGNQVPYSYALQRASTLDYGFMEDNLYTTYLPDTSNRLVATIPFTRAEVYGVMMLKIQLSGAAENGNFEYSLKCYCVLTCAVGATPVLQTRTVKNGGGSMAIFDTYTGYPAVGSASPYVVMTITAGAGLPGNVTTRIMVTQSYVSSAFS